MVASVTAPPPRRRPGGGAPGLRRPGGPARGAWLGPLGRASGRRQAAELVKAVQDLRPMFVALNEVRDSAAVELRDGELRCRYAQLCQYILVPLKIVLNNTFTGSFSGSAKRQVRNMLIMLYLPPTA